jgi:hypothetical protein
MWISRRLAVILLSVRTRPAWVYSLISPAIARTAGLPVRVIRSIPSS